MCGGHAAAPNHKTTLCPSAPFASGMSCNEITNQVILAPTYAKDAEGAIQKIDSLQYRMVVSSQTSPPDEDNVRR